MYQLIATGETRTARVKRLFVKDKAPYETAYYLKVKGPIAAGEVFWVYAEAHGNPRQKDQKELAWVTGIEVGIGTTAGKGLLYSHAKVARKRGNDLEKNRKRADTRGGQFTTMQAHHNGFTFRYVMRAINLRPGGHFILSPKQGKLGYMRFGLL